MEGKSKVKVVRTNGTDKDFIELVALLDKELAIRDGAEYDFYHQFNQINDIKYVVLAYSDSIAVGCGAIKPYDETSMEVKRMFTKEGYRGLGIASLILQELEAWAQSLGFKRSILETGLKQPEAIRLYNKNGYASIPNYGQYEGVENSVCFSKQLN